MNDDEINQGFQKHAEDLQTKQASEEEIQFLKEKNIQRGRGFTVWISGWFCYKSFMNEWF